MAKYTSGRQKNLKVGISSYSENLTSLEVIGKVGIGTTNPTSKLHVIGDVTATSFKGDGSQLTGVTGTQIVSQDPISTPVFLTFANNTGVTSLGVVTTGSNVLLVIPSLGNLGIGTTNPTSKLHVIGDGYFTGILTASRIFSSVYGEFTGGTISGTNIVGSALSISGISTLGVTSATNLTSQQLNVSGITTVGFITTNNIYSSGVVTATTFYGTFIGNASSATFATSSGIATFATSSGIATYATSSGIATYATNAGIATYATNAGIATYATNAGYSTSSGIATYATNAGIATYATSSGIATYATIAGYSTSSGIATYATNAGYSTSSGIATYATSSGIATYATNAGIATYATNAGYSTSSGIATYATSSGIATYATNAGIATYATNAGYSTSVIGGIASVTQLSVSGITTLGIITAGNIYSTGVITATSFSGTLSGYASSAGIATYATSSGIATYATNAGITTALQYLRTFQITGDVVASPISFDGTGNVSLAATIQPNSVGLGTDTTGDYVTNITGTANQITVTGGTGESSTPTLTIPSQFTAPQDVTVTRDLLVSRNLNVNGNITIGGTSATLFTTELKISDPDIVLGFRTDGSGNDVSNDNTANHGGVALASTEGTPLVQLFIAGIEITPATYKKIMWFKSGTFSGLGTDAWLINYAVGIGSTQFPTGTRLAAGNVQFTQNDLAVVRNINSTGVITATTFVGNLTNTLTLATSGTGLSGSTTFNNSGASTFTVTSNATNANTASAIVARDASGNFSAGTITASLTGTATTTTNIPNLIGAITSNNTTTSLGSFTSAQLATALTDETGSGVAVFSTSPTLVTPVLGAATATSIVVGSGVTIDISGINVTGVVTATSGFSGNASSATYATNSGISTYATNAGIATNLKGGVIGNIPYQSAADTTAFLANGSFGTILQSNGVGNAPTWTIPAPASAITGLTIRDEGAIVGGANSVSALNFVGSIVSVASTAGIATITFLDYVSNAGIATYATNAGTSTSVIGGIASVTQLTVSGVSTVGFITASNVYVTGVTTSGGVNVTTGNDYKVNGTSVLTNNTLGSGVVNSSLTSVGTLGQLNVTGVSTLGVTSTTNLTSQQLNVTGISTLGVTSATNLTSRQLNVSGISTFSDGPVLIGGGTSTGTAGQVLQISGINSSVYIGGSVGIGTTNPIATLTVAGNTANILIGKQYTNANAITLNGSTAAADYNILSTSTNNLIINRPSGKTIIFGQADSTHATFDSSNNLQLNSGSLAIGNFTPNYAIDAGAASLNKAGRVGSIIFGTAGTSYGIVGYNAKPSALNAWTYDTTDVASWVQFLSGGHVFYRAASGTAGNSITPLESARFDGSGNLGIGTTNPTSKLWVDGSGYFTGILTANRNASSTYGEFVGGSISGTNIVGTALSVSGISTFTNGPVLIGGGTSTGTASQKLQVTGGAYVSSNVGVAVTAPSFAVDISGDARVQSTGKMRFGGTAGSTNFYIQFNSTTNSLDFVSG